MNGWKDHLRGQFLIRGEKWKRRERANGIELYRQPFTMLEVVLSGNLFSSFSSLIGIMVIQVIGNNPPFLDHLTFPLYLFRLLFSG